MRAEAANAAAGQRFTSVVESHLQRMARPAGELAILRHGAETDGAGDAA